MQALTMLKLDTETSLDTYHVFTSIVSPVNIYWSRQLSIGLWQDSLNMLTKYQHFLNVSDSVLVLIKIQV
jgi:hypothetical protein